MSGAVVGIDPSISSTGIAVLGRGAPRFERVQSKPGADSLAMRVHRMRLMYSGIRSFIVDGQHVDLIVMEGPAYGSTNQMSHMLAGFWWLLVEGLDDIAPIAVVQPGTLKKFATGDGRAGKDEMLAAAIAAFPEAGIRNNDIADAAALASMGAAWLGRKFGGVFAPSGVGSVQAVRWPDVKGAGR